MATVFNWWLADSTPMSIAGPWHVFPLAIYIPGTLDLKRKSRVCKC